MKKALLFNLLLLCSAAQAQQIELRNTKWMTYLEEMAELENADESSIELLYEELSHLSENPLNINTAGKNDLERLPFLSDKQIEDISYYVYKYGPLLELHELKNVESLDLQTIRFIIPFLFVGEAERKSRFKWKDLVRYPKQEVLIRSDYTLQRKAGYRTDHYIGEPYYLSFRYGYRFRKKLQFGIAWEKDAGEKLWQKEYNGFDHYGFFIHIKEIGVLRNLFLGDYRLSFGEGLIVNTQFSVGKTTNITQAGLKNTGIKQHASTNENNYFRGLATAFRFRSVYLNLFASYRRQDANADSTFIYTIKTDGFNRTSKEMEKRDAAQIVSGGGNIQWRNENLTLGFTGVAYSFGGKELNPELKAYNLHYLRGGGHSNFGIHYMYQDRFFVFKGETALDGNRKWATLNHLILQPDSRIDFSLSVRNYQKDYNAFYGKAFGEASSVQNESGIYAGFVLRPSARWEISSYVDYFHFPWLRYGVDSPSSGKDFLVGVNFRPNSFSYLFFRYKYKEKEKNQASDDGRETFVLPYRQHRFRTQYYYSYEEKVNAKLQIDYSIYEEEIKRSSGWSASLNFTFAPDKNRFQWDCGMAYFHTGNWNTRINVYEKNILYAFSFPNYYGEGIRLYSVLRWKIYRKLSIYLKASNTHYFDRILISSGLDEIEGRNKSDLSALIRVSF